MTFAQLWEEESSCDSEWLAALGNSRPLVSLKVYATKDPFFKASLSEVLSAKYAEPRRRGRRLNAFYYGCHLKTVLR